VADSAPSSAVQAILSEVLALLPAGTARLLKREEVQALLERCQRLHDIGIEPAHIRHLCSDLHKR
jgi:hypothetical protein